MRTLCQSCAFALLLPAVALVVGCESGGHFTLLGYTTKPPFDCSIKTVYVPRAQNTTYMRDIEEALTKSVVRELGTSPYRVTSHRNGADTELVMKITNYRKNVIINNQLGEVRDAEVAIYIEVVWRDLRPGHEGDILSNPRRFDPSEKPLPGDLPAKAPEPIPLLVTPTANYAPEIGGTNLSANQKAVDRAARQIVNMMEVWR